MWPFNRNLTPEQQQRKLLRSAQTTLEYDVAQRNYFYDYLVEIRNWNTHLSNTRRFIADCARRCCGRRTCVVLGSGFCFDVPVLELSRMFDKVYLVDMVHPAKVVQKMREFKNVEFITEDITKIAIETVNSIDRYKDFSVDTLISSPNYSSGNYCDHLDMFDFVVSVNTLTFLDKPIVAYLGKIKLVDDISRHTLQTFVHQYHIGMLPHGKSCVISPISERLFNSDGLQMYDHSIAFIKPESIRDPLSWTWNYSNDSQARIEYSVKAWEF